jgi:hypothetical protein
MYCVYNFLLEKKNDYIRLEGLDYDVLLELKDYDVLLE